MSHRRRSSTRAAALAVVLLALAGAGFLASRASAPAPPPAGQGAGPLQENEQRSWYRNFDYGVEVDGKVLPDAGLYQIVGRPYMLIYGGGMEGGFVLSFEPKVVRAVKRDAVLARNEFEVLLSEASFAGSSPIPYLQDGAAAVVFYAGTRRIRIARVPPIVGETNVQEIFQNNPLYKRGMDEYRPKPDIVDTLKRQAKKVSIEVWFGSWCPHCQQVVPQFLKIMEAASNPNLAVTYHGVPREFSKYPPALSKDIRGLPTFIFLRDGKEFARIRGGPARSTLEDEIGEILRTGKSPVGL